jgi:hypothetical protein
MDRATRMSWGVVPPTGAASPRQANTLCAEPDSALGGGTGILVVFDQAAGIDRSIWDESEEFCKYLQSEKRA